MPGTGGAQPLGSLAGPACTRPCTGQGLCRPTAPQHCPLPSPLGCLLPPALPCPAFLAALLATEPQLSVGNEREMVRARFISHGLLIGFVKPKKLRTRIPQPL